VKKFKLTNLPFDLQGPTGMSLAVTSTGGTKYVAGHFVYLCICLTGYYIDWV